MDRLDAMAMFVRVVETGSFSKAAREFATTQPTVTKQVAAIESRLNVRLLNRNTRGVSLTEVGTLYYDKCKDILREAENWRRAGKGVALATVVETWGSAPRPSTSPVPSTWCRSSCRCSAGRTTSSW